MKINRQNFENATKRTYLEYMKLFPVLKKERNKQYGMIILTFSMMSIFGVFAINPTLTTIAELQRKLEDARLVEKSLSQKIKNLSSLQNKYSLLSNDLPLVLAAVPQAPQAARFIGQLQAITIKSNVTLLGVDTGDMAIAQPVPAPEGVINFNIKVTGTYDQVNTFIENLTDFERIVVVNSLAVTKKAVTDRTMDIDVQGSAHFKQ